MAPSAATAAHTCSQLSITSSRPRSAAASAAFGHRWDHVHPGLARATSAGISGSVARRVAEAHVAGAERRPPRRTGLAHSAGTHDGDPLVIDDRPSTASSSCGGRGNGSGTGGGGPRLHPWAPRRAHREAAGWIAGPELVGLGRHQLDRRSSPTSASMARASCAALSASARRPLSPSPRTSRPRARHGDARRRGHAGPRWPCPPGPARRARRCALYTSPYARPEPNRSGPHHRMLGQVAERRAPPHPSHADGSPPRATASESRDGEAVAAPRPRNDVPTEQPRSLLRCEFRELWALGGGSSQRASTRRDRGTASG